MMTSATSTERVKVACRGSDKTIYFDPARSSGAMKSAADQIPESTRLLGAGPPAARAAARAKRDPKVKRLPAQRPCGPRGWVDYWGGESVAAHHFC